MPTRRKILNFSVDDDLLRKLEDFRFENRFDTMSRALRSLVTDALERHERRRRRRESRETDPPEERERTSLFD